MSAQTAQRQRPSRTVQQPVMKVTPYDKLSSWMIAIVFGLGLLTLAAVMYWWEVAPEKTEFLVPMEMVESPGGFEDGAPDETLKIESPEDPDPNPTTTEEVLDPSEVTETVEQVVQFSDKATEQAQDVMAQATEPSGNPGSADGTGRRGLGNGPGQGGVPAEQRWFIQYADQASLDEYAKQLDFFGIEMGALLKGGQLSYMTGMSGSPKTRTATSGKGESRLYMTWQGGTRREADEKLFQKASINARGAVLFHFYPKQTEQMLLQLEYNYAKRSAKEIRRTYFVVVKKGNGYAFVVTRQTYLK
ncbi:MAG: hypothetical protein KDA58_16120 [Planctomycetaceae bacterium]|nr:hypothetical protein [Planctomycetaceae bacterium]